MADTDLNSITPVWRTKPVIITAVVVTTMTVMTVMTVIGLTRERNPNPQPARPRSREWSRD